MKAPGQGNNGDQMHGPGDQSGSDSQSGSSWQGNSEFHKGSGMGYPGQMNQMQKGGARHEAGLDSKNPGNEESQKGPGQNDCPGMMGQGSDDHKLGPHGDTCPCMRNSGMQPGQDNRYSGHQERENQDQQPGNSRESGRHMSTQCPGFEKMNEGNHGDRSYPRESHCQGFNGKDTSSFHHRFHGNPDESDNSGQTNQEQVYLVVAKQG